MHFLERHQENIVGILSCFDRVILNGSLPDIGYAKAATNYLHAKGIMIFDFPHWAARARDQIHHHAKALADDHEIEIEFIRKFDSFRKEDRITEILKTRGEHPGLVHVFSAMENCSAYKPWHDKPSGNTYLRYMPGRCLHYYFYFIHPDFGRCYLRVPTWAPFRMQFYFNGHNWLACEFKKKKMGYEQVENAFVWVADFEKAQKLADRLNPSILHRALKRAAKEYVKSLGIFPSGVHWSICQVEYATDVVFDKREVLAPVYEELVRTLAHAVKPDNLAMFLGRRLDKRFTGELGSQFSTRIEGHCIRHHLGKSGVKMYDKFGLVLRVETYSNDISSFKHYREVVHRGGSRENKLADMKKTIYSLPALSEILFSCNRRYLEFLSAVDDPRKGIKKTKQISRPVRENGRSYRGFNLFHDEDAAVFHAIAQGGGQALGFRNRDLRRRLQKSASQVSFILKRLRNHGIIKKAARSYKYHLTSLGKEIVATSLKLKEMFIIPTLRGILNPA